MSATPVPSQGAGVGFYRSHGFPTTGIYPRPLFEETVLLKVISGKYLFGKADEFSQNLI